MNKHLSDIEDQLLVMDAQVGDAKAMEKLVGRWQKRLWFYAYRLTRNKEAAWDITQDTWLGIIKGLRKLHDPANFKAWAYKITTNKATDWIKKAKTNKHLSIEGNQGHQHKVNEEAGVKEFLQKLEVRKRVVLSLYYFEQLNISEISIALNIPKGTVKSRLHVARQELKKLWERHFE